MTGPTARLSRTPAHVRHAGRPLGADDDPTLTWDAPSRNAISRGELVEKRPNDLLGMS